MTKPKNDPYKTIKFMAYRLYQLPNTYNTSDLLRYAKFQLAIESGTLLKDPIWDKYTPEELLVEFFAHQFEKNSEFRELFEREIGDINGVVDDFAKWADDQIAKEKVEREKILGAMEEHVSFTPNIMGDE